MNRALSVYRLASLPTLKDLGTSMRCKAVPLKTAYLQFGLSMTFISLRFWRRRTRSYSTTFVKSLCLLGRVEERESGEKEGYSWQMSRRAVYRILWKHRVC